MAEDAEELGQIQEQWKGDYSHDPWDKNGAIEVLVGGDLYETTTVSIHFSAALRWSV